MIFKQPDISDFIDYAPYDKILSVVKTRNFYRRDHEITIINQLKEFLSDIYKDLSLKLPEYERDNYIITGGFIPHLYEELKRRSYDIQQKNSSWKKNVIHTISNKADLDVFHIKYDKVFTPGQFTYFPTAMQEYYKDIPLMSKPMKRGTAEYPGLVFEYTYGINTTVNYKDIKSVMPINVQLIENRDFTDGKSHVKSVIDRFDFRHLKGYYCGATKKLCLSPEIYDDLFSKTLTPIHPYTPYRKEKWNKHGYYTVEEQKERNIQTEHNAFNKLILENEAMKKKEAKVFDWKKAIDDHKASDWENALKNPYKDFILKSCNNGTTAADTRSLILPIGDSST